MTRTALELISQTGLGYSFDSLTNDDVTHPYTASVNKLVYVAVCPGSNTRALLRNADNHLPAPPSIP